MKQLILFVLLLGLSCPLAMADSASLEQIQRRYQEISSFKGTFRQHVLAEMQKAERTATGTVYFLKPGKMRWEYEPPNEQVILTDGTTLWLYDPLLDNVTLQPLDQVTRGTPLAFLLGLGDLSQDFTQRDITTRLIEQANTQVIELVPNEPIPGWQFIQLAINPETKDLVQVVLGNENGTYNKITFEQVAYNATLDDSMFHFDVADKEVIQTTP